MRVKSYASLLDDYLGSTSTVINQNLNAKDAEGAKNANISMVWRH
jgi:hypothetical protein